LFKETESAKLMVESKRGFLRQEPVIAVIKIATFSYEKEF